MNKITENNEYEDFFLVEPEAQEDKLSFHEEDGFIFISPANMNTEDIKISSIVDDWRMSKDYNFTFISDDRRREIINNTLKNYVFCSRKFQWLPKYKMISHIPPSSLNNLFAIQNFVKVAKSKDLVLPPQTGIFTLFDRSAELQIINEKNKSNKIIHKMNILDNKKSKKKPSRHIKFIPKQDRHHNRDYNRHGHRNN